MEFRMSTSVRGTYIIVSENSPHFEEPWRPVSRSRGVQVKFDADAMNWSSAPEYQQNICAATEGSVGRREVKSE